MEDNLLEITIEPFSYFEDDEYIVGEYLIINGERVYSDGYHLKAILYYLKCNEIGNLDMEEDNEEDIQEVLESLGYNVIMNFL